MQPFVKFIDFSRTKNIDSIINDGHDSENSGKLYRNLTLRDLTAMAIAAIVGAGIFGTIGNASASGGPAVSLLFIFTALACGLSALCYAEFASRIPISGSAYTYAYSTLGEFIAWIIGWTLLMEYSVGNIAVAISWSDYFTSFLRGFNINFPEFLSSDYMGAYRGYEKTMQLLHSGTPFQQVPGYLQEAYKAWTTAPMISSIRIIADIPAFFITCVITALVYIGIKETKQASNIMVLLKVLVIIAVILIGGFYVNPVNWHPFAPNGISGVLKGVSAVFFAYIGFDAISTTAEECKNPQRDLPKAMMLSLIICTILYIALTLVLTGMVNYKELAVGDPLAFVFAKNNLNWISGIIGFSAIIAMASVLLIFQVGQPRIWMSMSRDGLLPKRFSVIHPRFKTPGFSTIITGVFVGVPALFMNLTEVTDLTSIGTLFAFAIVCAGVLKFKPEDEPVKGFRIPYINGKYIVILILMAISLIFIIFFPKQIAPVFNFKVGWEEYKQYVPYLVFICISIWVAYRTFIRSYSLLPILGLLINLYLMTELGITNWVRFTGWLIIGLVIYFTYSYSHSKLKYKTIN